MEVFVKYIYKFYIVIFSVKEDRNYLYFFKSWLCIERRENKDGKRMVFCVFFCVLGWVGLFLVYWFKLFVDKIKMVIVILS